MKKVEIVCVVYFLFVLLPSCSKQPTSFPSTPPTKQISNTDLKVPQRQLPQTVDEWARECKDLIMAFSALPDIKLGDVELTSPALYEHTTHWEFRKGVELQSRELTQNFKMTVVVTQPSDARQYPAQWTSEFQDGSEPHIVDEPLKDVRLHFMNMPRAKGETPETDLDKPLGGYVSLDGTFENDLEFMVYNKQLGNLQATVWIEASKTDVAKAKKQRRETLKRAVQEAFSTLDECLTLGRRVPPTNAAASNNVSNLNRV